MAHYRIGEYFNGSHASRASCNLWRKLAPRRLSMPCVWGCIAGSASVENTFLPSLGRQTLVSFLPSRGRQTSRTVSSRGRPAGYCVIVCGIIVSCAASLTPGRQTSRIVSSRGAGRLLCHCVWHHCFMRSFADVQHGNSRNTRNLVLSLTPKAYGDACWNAVSKVESSSPTATSSSSPATSPMVFGIGSKRSASDSLDSDSDHLFKRIHYGAEEVSASPLSQSMSPATGLPLEVMDTPATTLGSLDSLDTPLEAPAPIAPAPGVDDLDTLASLGPAPALDGFALDPWQSLLSPETNAVPSVSDSESNSPMSETFRDPILTSDELQMAPQMARPDAFGPLDCNLMDPLNVQKPSANWDLNFDDSVMPMRFTDESLSIMPPFEPSTVDYSSILD